jgi:hypothetical protein
MLGLTEAYSNTAKSQKTAIQKLNPRQRINPIYLGESGFSVPFSQLSIGFVEPIKKT